MVTVDEFVHQAAKDSKVNISQVCERALREKTLGDISDEPEIRQCCKCGDTDPHHIKVWLCPDERWICEEPCLRREVNKVIIGVVPT